MYNIYSEITIPFLLESVLYSLIAHIHLVSFGTGRPIALTTYSFHKEDRNHNFKNLKPLQPIALKDPG